MASMNRFLLTLAAILGVTTHVCDNADGKKAAASKIKTLTCKWDAKATQKKLKRYGPSLSLKAKKLTAGFNWDTANLATAVRDWLMNNL